MKATKYLVLCEERYNDDESLFRWKKTSRQLLGSILRGKSFIPSWSLETRAGLSSAGYYLWREHIPPALEEISEAAFFRRMREYWTHILGRNVDQMPQWKSQQDDLLQAQATNIIADALRLPHGRAKTVLRHIENDMLLAKTAFLLMPENEAYQKLQDSVLEQVYTHAQTAVESGEVRAINDMWPTDNSFESWASGENAKKIDETRFKTFTDGFVKCLVDCAKTAYPDVFGDLPAIDAIISAQVPVEKNGYYSYPSRKKGGNCSFQFSLRCAWSSSFWPNIISGALHESDHLLQTHLGNAYETDLIKRDHPLYSAAVAFGTYREKDWERDGFPINNRVPYIASARPAYHAAPRERAAYRLSNALNSRLSRVLGFRFSMN